MSVESCTVSPIDDASTIQPNRPNISARIIDGFWNPTYLQVFSHNIIDYISLIFDQELISYRYLYRYSSCYCSFCCGDHLKTQGSVVSNRIGMKFGRNVIHIKYASIDGVGFSIWRHCFKMAAMTSFDAENSCICWVNMKRLQCQTQSYIRSCYWFAKASFSGPLLSVEVEFCLFVCVSATLRSNISKTKGARRKVTIGSL